MDIKLKPEEIPQYTGDLEQLEKDHAALKKDAGHVRTTGADVHSHFQGLSAFYKAPEAEKLFATTKPVKDRADEFADDLETVASALADYADEVRPLKTKLEGLKKKAQAFIHDHKDDDDADYDDELTAEHNQIRDDINATVAAFWAAERTCYNKIVALWNGPKMVAGDGSKKEHQYGFKAEDLKNAKVPWGDPVEQKHHWYDVGHWVKSFAWDGIVVDGIWGTIKGLGTLVGVDGWDAAGQAWKGLAQLGTGLAILTIGGPGAAAFMALPDDKLPSWLRDSRNTMKQTGKALVAWDEWGKNPGRAAGGVTFNVLTTVFTGGAGGAAAGAGKAGAVVKALSVAGKAGRVIDPMTYVGKAAGAGLSKIGDIAKSIKGIGKVDMPPLPENAVELPEGAVALSDGTVHLPEGSAVPAGAVELPNGSVKLPEGSVPLPEGTVKLTDFDGNTVLADPKGNLYDETGALKQHHADAPQEGSPNPHPTTDADTPRVEAPAREPALVGAGAAHMADDATPVHLGSSVDDVGRLGDDTAIPGGHVGDAAGGHRLPGSGPGHDMPTAHAGDNVPGNGAHHIPSSHAANHLPGGHAGDLGRSPSGGHEPHTGNGSHSGGHGDGPSGPHDPTHSRPHHDDATPHSHGDDGPHHTNPHHHESGAGGHGDDGASPDTPADGDHQGHGQGHHSSDPHGGEAAADDIQVGDQPAPPPGPGEKLLGDLPEDRVRRSEDGLISHVDDQPVNEFLDKLSHERALKYLEAKENGTFPRAKTGACVGSVVDLRTGKVIEGINGPKGSLGELPMDRLHPTLLERYEMIADAPPHRAPILAHAEVKATNELLWARREAGLPDDASALTELRASVQFPFMPDMATGVRPRPAPFCGNCNHMLEGVPSSYGRYLKDPPGPENWIP
ncbi:hypothetical protein [Streptomyces sp. NPDC053560]|uniref:hypothetical protein n=1 Tax=Streptomyces sp. NPDC053560 TaxID=3365711 RepID=UPI0037CD0CAE